MVALLLLDGQDGGMGEVVNLRRERKRRRRDEAAAAADANRALHGATLAERKVRELTGARLEAALDGARLQEAPPDGEA